MCNCKHSTAIVGEDGHGKCQINSSISVGEGWESGYGEYDGVLDESYRRPETSFRSDRSFRTPTRGIATVVPKETLQGSIADTPELAEGVAIVRRRLDFDDSTFDQTQNGCGLCRRNQSRRSTKASYHTGPNLSRTRKNPSCGKS